MKKDYEEDLIQEVSRLENLLENCPSSEAVRRLSLVGKIVVLKSLVASQLVYVFSPLQTNHDVIKEINKLFFIFSWNDKGDKIKCAVIYLFFCNLFIFILPQTRYNT